MRRNSYLIASLFGLWLLEAYVLMELWNWFAVSAFHVPNLSYAQVCGLLLGVLLFWGFTKDEPWPSEDRWMRLLTILEANLSREAKETLEKDVNFQSAPLSPNMAQYLLRQVSFVVSVWVIGWLIHRFFS
jgi:hypothetical protein